MIRPPTLDQQIADAAMTLRQRRRMRSRLSAAHAPMAVEIAQRRIYLAEAILATLEDVRAAQAARPALAPPRSHAA